ncbi:MAG: ATP-binding domain-containing protein [Pseudomonadota bacterium]|nr:ATP-binding domain-containing protein [Pseudomonadota bacterium]
MNDHENVEIGSEEYLKSLSTETLDSFSRIAVAASNKSSTSPSGNPIANAQTFTGATAQQGLEQGRRSLQEGYRRLQVEPAIARIIYEDEDGKSHTQFISRTISIGDRGVSVASQRAPIGRLASLDVGDSAIVELPGGSKELTLLEVTIFQPKKDNEGWDALDSVYKHESGLVKSFNSLRQLLTFFDIEDDFDAFLQGGESEAAIIDGITHQIRTAMELRDQPILDKFQDEIYRLPLDSQLFIAGPPGTGKTTTLIKRLGQKLDFEYLSDTEKKLVEKEISDIPYEQNWLMFTPTELLKHYLKEAFSREQVPAGGQHIRTWEKTRHDLARNVMGLLQTGNNKGKFIFKPEVHYLKPEIEINPSQWFAAFEGFFLHQFFKSLQDACKNLSTVAAEEKGADNDWLVGLQNLLESQQPNLSSFIAAIEPYSGSVQTMLGRYNSEANKLSESTVKSLYKLDKEVFVQLAELLNQMSLEKIQLEEDEELDEEDATRPLKQLSPADAAKQLIQVFKSIGRTRYLGRSISKTSKNGRILAFLGDKAPEQDVLKKIGELVFIVGNLRVLERASRNYVTNIGNVYKRFCREHGDFYQNKEDMQYICAPELDAIILLTLKHAHQLLNVPAVSRNANESNYSFLSVIRSQFKDQIFVDEATDFSTLQLAAMQLLVSPATRSFFACGDFNQRLTREGIKESSDFDALPMKLSIRPITTVYRQSQILNDLARKLLSLSNGDTTSVGELPKDYHHQGVQPVLAEGLQNIDEIAQWLAGRIDEVERSVAKLPTIGVLVNDESVVAQLAEALNKSLSDLNITAEACSDGKSLGEAADVRIFSAEHIKGLEFEAVFFVGIDELAEQKPDLFEKYLYVGVTRAASYLGITCKTRLPEKIESLRASFMETWG